MLPFILHFVREDVNSYIAQGLGHDPTLPRAPDWQCPKCSNSGAVYFQLPERVADDAMTLVYVCTSCTFYQVKGKETHDRDEKEDEREEEEKEDERDEKVEPTTGIEEDDEMVILLDHYSIIIFLCRSYLVMT